ncbi:MULTISPECIES: ammonium transporter [unclassified Microbacterium]|uniref:ammonium transporter n=1 Tax=unclassified Microbacterium TaxID=2609290 RepID=UPI0030188DD0
MDSGNVAWTIMATALCVFITPGIAFYYGGMVRAKSVVSMMMLSFGAMGVVGVLWILYGFGMYSITAANDGSFPGFRFAGNPFTEHFALAGLDQDTLIGAAFGATFAIATTAIVSGAIADRARFGPWLLFAGLFATFVYFPVAGWVWGEGGWIFNLGSILGFDGVATIDYAGGTAAHINAAAGALALALVLGKRTGFAKGVHTPHNVPLALTGVAIIFFAWFGFNTGAEGAFGLLGTVDADGAPASHAGLIVVNTLGAACAGVLGWTLVERLKEGKATSIGAGSGAIAGLIAITPACAALDPGWALLLGVVSGAICALAIELKFRLGFDDSLDVVGLHGIGGIVGCWYLGFFAQGTGLIYSGNLEQLIVQVIASVAVPIYSFGVSWIIGTAIEKTIGFRVRNEDELAGIDTVLHGERGYSLADAR